MTFPDETICLFHAQLEEAGGTYQFEVPAREVDLGGVEAGRSYRVAVLPPAAQSASSPTSDRGRDRGGRGPPVAEGETVEVEIEDIGEQGDGIARVGPGYIVFVPDTDIGDRVTVEVTQVRENFAFGEVIEGPY
ncbi:MAG: TRAM domain-containing protein [Halobacteriales archaeon]